MTLLVVQDLRRTARKSTAPYSGRSFPESSRRTPCQFPTWLITRRPFDGSHDYHRIVRCGVESAILTMRRLLPVFPLLADNFRAGQHCLKGAERGSILPRLGNGLSRI